MLQAYSAKQIEMASLGASGYAGAWLDTGGGIEPIVVPEEAIVSEGLRQIVYPVKDNKVERRVIRIGQRQGGKVEVLEGLKAGETVVVLGVQRVRPGAIVQPDTVPMDTATGKSQSTGATNLAQR